jgi:ABC-2 type transport system ATP-binding protein
LPARRAGELSGGEQRRLHTALALVHRPSLVLLDEPTTGVDPVSRVDLWRLVSEAAARGAAVLLSTTYLDEAERAHHLVALDGGAVLAAGTAEHVRAALPGSITRSAEPGRPAWAWRRGRVHHEYWPPGTTPPAGSTAVVPDLQDAVLALSLLRRHEAAA